MEDIGALQAQLPLPAAWADLRCTSGNHDRLLPTACIVFIYNQGLI